MISISVYHCKIKVPVPRTKFCHFVGSSNCISLIMQWCFLIFVIGVLNKVFRLKFHRRITFLLRHMCITRLIWVNLLFYSYRYSTSHHKLCVKYDAICNFQDHIPLSHLRSMALTHSNWLLHCQNYHPTWAARSCWRHFIYPTENSRHVFCY